VFLKLALLLNFLSVLAAHRRRTKGIFQHSNTVQEISHPRKITSGYFKKNYGKMLAV